MTFVGTLRQWDEAVASVDKDDLSKALSIFLSIEEPNSKIYFNIGCLHLLYQNLDAAEKAFDGSISKDEHMAVAFFQRGITCYKKEQYEESLADFQHAFKELRGNQLIDYTTLGLRVKLFAWEVLHNMALCQAQLGLWEKAQENLLAALDYKTEAKVVLIDRALQSTLKQKLFKLVEFPSKVLFKPNKNYVAELEKRDYLGKAKVVASIIPQDDFSGFAPLMPQADNGPADPKAPEVLRAFEGEPHTVLFEFVPETSDELAVVPGNVVFVLQKGTDNWASVIFNGRRGLVPYNYLERLEMTLSSKRNQDGNDNRQDISEPPTREPPTRPKRKQAPNPNSEREGDTQTEDAEMGESNTCIVKVHFTYNIAVSLSSGSAYTTLMEKISKKLNLPAASFTLSFNSSENGLTVIDRNTDMESVWISANGGRITLWCDVEDVDNVDREKMEEEPQSQTFLVAVHSFDSANPEDLSFHQGDRITLLSKVNQDWFEGQCNGNTGIFPAAFVEEVSERSQ
ncbi:neutrophil cytosol factor 2 [Lampris incognitus]|uniref:neutrophil cytosol factor 2 n=1 Tax=Lampris incognitus TaxID=2546036 RepID=UPI0024B5CB4E|nr:neutrophil cytosol factor 2 [Lampris incognitus]